MRLDADEGGPVRCAVLPAGISLAETVALLTGLSVVESSLLVDNHIGRGEN